MHDIWNPWHGCRKCSEGCANCYMFTMDRMRGLDGSVVRRNKGGFDFPLQHLRDGSLKVKPGELIRICMNSDFLVEEADAWRDEVWQIIAQRPDVRFFILTKRPERFAVCLPPDWGDGWDNVMLNVSCENQRRADERIPVLLATPAKHKGIMCAPFIGPVDVGCYLDAGTGIEQVVCGGENYEGARLCDYRWVVSLYEQCRSRDVTFAFIETGSRFVKDGRVYHIRNKNLQAQQAYKSGLRYRGRPIRWQLKDNLGLPIPRNEWAVPRFRAKCRECGSLMVCNGCSNCGACPPEPLYTLEELCGPDARRTETATWT